MAYRWRYLRTDGTDVPGPDMIFEDRAGAEDWLGSHWAELLETGVDQVTLLDADTEVYGPMSLHPIDP